MNEDDQQAIEDRRKRILLLFCKRVRRGLWEKRRYKYGDIRLVEWPLGIWFIYYKYRLVAEGVDLSEALAIAMHTLCDDIDARSMVHNILKAFVDQP